MTLHEPQPRRNKKFKQTQATPKYPSDHVNSHDPSNATSPSRRIYSLPRKLAPSPSRRDSAPAKSQHIRQQQHPKDSLERGRSPNIIPRLVQVRPLASPSSKNRKLTRTKQTAPGRPSSPNPSAPSPPPSSSSSPSSPSTTSPPPSSPSTPQTTSPTSPSPPPSAPSWA